MAKNPKRVSDKPLRSKKDILKIMKEYCGKKAMLKMYSTRPKYGELFRIPVWIFMVQINWGRLRLLIQPVTSPDAGWVDDSRIVLVDEWNIPHETEYEAAFSKQMHGPFAPKVQTGPPICEAD